MISPTSSFSNNQHETEFHQSLASIFPASPPNTDQDDEAFWNDFGAGCEHYAGYTFTILGRLIISFFLDLRNLAFKAVVRSDLMFLKVVYPVKQVLEVDGLNPTAETILLGILTLYLQQLSTHEFLTTLIEPLDPKQPEELEQQDNTASLTTEASPFLRLRPQEIISNLDKLEDSRQLNQMLANMRPTLKKSNLAVDIFSMSPLKDEAASFINRIFQRCGLSFTTNLRPISCYLPVVTKDLPLSFDIHAKDDQDLFLAQFKEWLQTEDSYLEKLTALTCVYQPKISYLASNAPSPNSQISAYEYRHLFYNADELCELCRQFVYALKGLDESSPDFASNFADLLFQASLELKKPYERYIQNYAFASELVIRIEKKSPDVMQLLKRCQMHYLARYHTLAELMAEPFQRIPRYKLMTERLLLSTDKKNLSLRLKLKAAWENFNLVANLTTSGRIEDMRELYNLYDAINGCPEAVLNLGEKILLFNSFDEVDCVSFLKLREILIFLMPKHLLLVERTKEDGRLNFIDFCPISLLNLEAMETSVGCYLSCVNRFSAGQEDIEYWTDLPVHCLVSHDQDEFRPFHDLFNDVKVTSQISKNCTTFADFVKGGNLYVNVHSIEHCNCNQKICPNITIYDLESYNDYEICSRKFQRFVKSGLVGIFASNEQQARWFNCLNAAKLTLQQIEEPKSALISSQSLHETNQQLFSKSKTGMAYNRAWRKSQLSAVFNKPLKIHKNKNPGASINDVLGRIKKKASNMISKRGKKNPLVDVRSGGFERGGDGKKVGELDGAEVPERPYRTVIHHPACLVSPTMENPRRRATLLGVFGAGKKNKKHLL